MRIGVFVGSFNPPHDGHYQVMRYVLDKDIVDLLLVLPTPNYWDKNNLVSVEDRVQMLKFYEDEKIIIDSKHNYYSYTYQILRSIKKDYPNDELYLVIGSDNLEEFHLWKNVDEILENKVVVLKRGEYQKNVHLSSYEKQFIYCDDFQSYPISSTKIREGSSNYLNDKVKEYIKSHSLY